MWTLIIQVQVYHYPDSLSIASCSCISAMFYPVSMSLNLSPFLATSAQSLLKVKSTFIDDSTRCKSNSAVSGLCGDDLKVTAVGSHVAGCFKAVVLVFKAPSREPVSELHRWLAGAQDSLTLGILRDIHPSFTVLNLTLLHTTHYTLYPVLLDTLKYDWILALKKTWKVIFGCRCHLSGQSRQSSPQTVEEKRFAWSQPQTWSPMGTLRQMWQCFEYVILMCLSPSQ